MITIDPIKRPSKKSSSVDTTEIMKEVDLKFADLIDGAPDNLNTIKELAEAVANIPKIDNLATKKEIPTKLSLLTNDANYVLEDSLKNGVYAVTTTGKLVNLEHADASCVGVAVIATKTKFIIAKHDLGDSLQFYWGKNLKGLDIPNIENLSEDDSLDYTLGKNNTQALISSYNALGVEMDNQDVSKSLQTLYENGDTNWYLPSTGLLVNMYTKFPKINEVLSKIGGTLLTPEDAYWSSSECSDEAALAGILREGTSIIYEDFKDELCLVRLVRDIPEPKLVKDRISNLETKVSDLEEIQYSISRLNDVEIINTISWTNGVWHYLNNSDYGSPFMRLTYRYSNKIDISEYDYLKLSGFWNGGPSSTSGNTLPTVTFFGNGEPIEWKMYESGEYFEIDRSYFSAFDKLEIIVTAFLSEETYVPSILVTKNKGLKDIVSDVSKLMKILDSDMYNIKSIVTGVEDKDITDTIYWTKGMWNFTTGVGGGSLYMLETFRYSNKIDISKYYSVTLSGLINGGPNSTNTNVLPTISYYGDGEPIKFELKEKGSTFIIYRNDYADYTKLEIVVTAMQEAEDQPIPNIKVTTKSILEGSHAAKRIVLCGDSLCGNDSALIKKQLTSIAKAMGYEIILNAMGGENIIGNLTRNGGIAIRVTSDFVMPASGSVDIEVESAWMKSDGTYAQNPYNSATNRDVRIMGVKGKLTRNSTTSYTFTRNDEGESFKVGVGALLWDEALWSCQDYPHIWFTGQNMGYENEQDWADMINMAARNFGENFIVCSTALAGTTNQLVRCATKTFGNKYINLKAYTEGQAVYDGLRLGLISLVEDASNYANLFWPGDDKVHQNNLLSYIWSVLMWNTLRDLGYVEGDRIESGEYYLL